MAKCVNVHIQYLEDVSPSIFKQLIKKNLGNCGRMLDIIREYQNDVKKSFYKSAFTITKGKRKIIVFYIKNRHGEIKSWGMVHKFKRCPDTIDLYTSREYRKQGYATAIAKVIKDYTKKKYASYCWYRTSIYDNVGYLCIYD